MATGSVEQSAAVVSHNITLQSGFTTASWGGITAKSIGKILYVSGYGIRKDSAEPGLMAIVDGVEFAQYINAAGVCEDSSSSSFLVIASESGVNKLSVDLVKTANANLYFEIIIPLK